MTAIMETLKLLILTAGIVVFNLTHLASAKPSWRSDILDKIGRKGFITMHAIGSSLAVALIIYGYYERDFAPLYQPALWAANFNQAIMLIALWLVASEGFNGHMKRIVKAPALAGTAIWAFGHLLANGDVHSVILFGGFLIYAFIGLFFKRHHQPPETAYRIKSDGIALIVGIVAYSAIGLAHPYFTGISVL
ncbi:MAG: NnrU family protein [Rhizobiales bacterium]|nr:NnrU family protein [Hyphomicrobiales bacterium]NRB14645.1 NnrU family protein [Hyphomicrobiales bacterium]